MASYTILFEPRLAHSSSFFPLRRSDPPPPFTSTRFDDGILPTPHFSTRLPSLSFLRRSGSFPTRSGPPQQVSSTPVARSSPSTLGAHPLSFSSLPSPQFSPSSPHPSPVLASLPIPSRPLPIQERKKEKHADPGKENQNRRKSRENSRNLLNAFLRSRKEETLYGHCDVNNARRILSKGSTLSRG